MRAGETTVLSCAVPLVGRYVYVSLRANEWLTLCEVEVYSPDASKKSHSLILFDLLFNLTLELVQA